MKTFEEKWTAWLDGQLSGKELGIGLLDLKVRGDSEHAEGAGRSCTAAVG